MALAAETIDRKRMINEAVGLMSGWDPGEPTNHEYLRGMSELIARCFLREDTADEAKQIRGEIVAKLFEVDK